MRLARFWAIVIISFFSIAVGTLLHRFLAVSLCTVIGFNSTACFLGDSGKVNAAVPLGRGDGSAIVAQNVDIFRNDGGSSQQQPTDIFDNPNPQGSPQPGVDIFTNPNRVNNPPNQSEPTATRTIAFDSPTVRQLASDTFELNLVSKEGCNFVTTINNTGSQIYQSSTKFTPSSAEVCGISPFTARLSPDGTRMEVRVDGSPESVVIEKIDNNSMKAVLKSATGENELGIFPIEELQQKGLGNLKTLAQHKQVRQSTSQAQTGGLTAQRQDTRGQAAFREATCTAGRRTCAGIATIGAVASAMGLIPLPSSIPLEAIGAGATVFGYGCFLLFGGTPPLPFLPKPISTAYDFTTGMRSLSEEREGRYRSGQAPGVRTPNDNPRDIATYGDRISRSIRKAIGIDFCDNPTQPQQTAQQPQQQLRNCRIRGVEEYNNITMNRGECAIQGPVMTVEGLVDGKTQCGVCNTFIGNLPPHAGSCKAGMETDPRIAFLGLNKPILCPPNWDSGW